MKLPFGLKIERDKRRDKRRFNIYAAALGITAAIPMYMLFLPGALKGNHVDIACVAGTTFECVLSLAVAIKEINRLQAIERRKEQIAAAKSINPNPG